MGKKDRVSRNRKGWSVFPGRICRITRAVCSMKKNRNKIKKLILEIRRMGGNSGKRRRYG